MKGGEGREGDEKDFTFIGWLMHSMSDWCRFLDLRHFKFILGWYHGVHIWYKRHGTGYWKRSIPGAVHRYCCWRFSIYIYGMVWGGAVLGNIFLRFMHSMSDMVWL